MKVSDAGAQCRVLLLIMLAHSIPFSKERDKLFLTGSFAPITFSGTEYESGGAKISYAPGKYMSTSLRYLAEAESPCSKMDCRSYQNNSTYSHEISELSLLGGPILKMEHGYLASLIGIGGISGQKIKIDSVGSESRIRYKNISLPLDLEAMLYISEYFGVGITGYGDFNKENDIFGVMGSIQIRIL